MSSPSDSHGPTLSTVRKWNRQSRRGKLRNGTWILPTTGEHIRRQITLRSPANSATSMRNGTSDSTDSQRRDLSQGSTFQRAIDNTIDISKSFLNATKSPLGRAILKCSIAYTIASLAVFLSPISRFLGHQDGKHMVATITVYFHPARSAGSMEEGIILAFAAFLYATFITTSSMAVSVLCDTHLNTIELGYILVLVIFCGGGLGLIGWFKQKYGKPLVNVACSLCSLAIILVLTKESAVQTGVFSNDKIVQMMKMLIMGSLTTTAVCLLLWPVYARVELRETMIKATGSLGDMLTMITGAFLSGSEAELKSDEFTRASNCYKSVFPQLTTHLQEAKFEHYVLGSESLHKREARLVTCMQKLSQSIGGLQSAATTQFSLLKESGEYIETPIVGIPPSSGSNTSRPSTMEGRKDRFAMLAAIEEASEESSGGEEYCNQTQLQDRGRNGQATTTTTILGPRSTSEIFSSFIIHLGPSMKSLVYTLSQILQELPFSPAPDYKIAINEHFITSLDSALMLYSSARDDALKQLYESKAELEDILPENVQADFEEVAASCGYFSFNLQDFAEEMQTFLSVLSDLKEEMERSRKLSWTWIRFWWRKSSKKPSQRPADPEQEGLINTSEEPEHETEVLDVRLGRKPKISLKTPKLEESSKKGSLYWRVLRLLKYLTNDDIHFGVKVGIGAALFASLAYIPATRPFYQHWRGEWGLVSYMVVSAMTVGASNTTGLARFIGTLIGAGLAILVWMICQGNAIGLAFFGWVISAGCFYIILALGKAPFGRFIMLTYNLSALYAYSLSQKEADDDDDEGGINPILTEIALHRVIAVMAGVLWGMIITRVIWPISARKRFKNGLSLLWLRMGLIWKRDPLAMLLEGESTVSYMNLNEEFALQRYVIRLDTLRREAQSEFELQGPFPVKEYGRIMDSTSKMLSAFHAMNVVIQKQVSASEGEAVLLKYTSEERAQLCARISHLFQVIASSLKLEYPLLRDAIPNIVNTRDRLLARIYQYRKNSASGEAGFPVVKDEDYEMLYAYTLVTGQLAEEIQKVEREVESLFGVMNEDSLELR
ncbi:Fusaric acid resistance protein-like-domain-containing protein [Xylogone sp. PMI_703]|nr:Fusaric acid resistance protein-like-domain-containing protein [Xylogone sp. PMI_703]